MNFKTKDLALATVLRLEGYRHICMELNEDNEAVWVFEASSLIDEIAHEYSEGMQAVEPRRYNIELSKVRGELFTFLKRKGISPRKRPAQRG